MSTSPSCRRKKTKQTNHGVWNTDAKHYLDVFRLMSNLQVTCVDVCQRSRNVPTTYGQHMRNVWVIRWHTSKNFKHGKFVDELGVLRLMPAYYDVCQHTTAYANVLLTYTNLPITYSTCASVLDKFSYVDIRWLNRQGVTGPYAGVHHPAKNQVMLRWFWVTFCVRSLWNFWNTAR